MRPVVILPTAVAFLTGACGDDGGGLSAADFRSGMNTELDGPEMGLAGSGTEATRALLKWRSTMRQAARRAPDEIKSYVQFVLKGSNRFVDSLIESNLSLAAIDYNDPRMANLANPEYDAAWNRVSAFRGFDDDSSDTSNEIDPAGVGPSLGIDAG